MLNNYFHPQTVWLSLQGIGGIALHGLEMDNVDGQCPHDEPFQLLRTIVNSQACTFGFLSILL